MEEEQECLKELQQKWLLEAKALQAYKEKAEKLSKLGSFAKVLEVNVPPPVCITSIN
jgi:hypothetical protein